MKLTIKQTRAIDVLEDNITNDLLFGGGAGGGKSRLGCYWQIKRRLKFPGSRGFIGRKSFKALKDTTLKTFFEVAKDQGLRRGVHFELTGSNDKENPNCIVFFNGSLIYLRQLAQLPSDPDFDSLGSLEITDAFVDECNQCVKKAIDVLKSRLRYKLNEYCHKCASQEKVTVLEATKEGVPLEWICDNGHVTEGLIPKWMGSCNPSKNWVYKDFYKPQKEKTLNASKSFIQSLVNDNPYVSKSYIKNLSSLGKAMAERLLYGNWEYDDDPLKLFSDYDKVLELFTNEFIEAKGERYITADIAYLGSDIFVIGVWHGLVLEKVYAFDKVDETQVSKKIHDIRIKHNVPASNVCYDADGLKKYVKQSAETGYLKDALQFHNGGKAIGKENYYNLKTQCYFMLADMVNKNEIWCKDQEYRDRMIEELEQIKQMDRSDTTEPIRLEKKKDLKERLGRSPDFTDMLMMRMFFILAKPKVHKTKKSVREMGVNW